MAANETKEKFDYVIIYNGPVDQDSSSEIFYLQTGLLPTLTDPSLWMNY